MSEQTFPTDPEGIRRFVAQNATDAEQAERNAIEHRPVPRPTATRTPGTRNPALRLTIYRDPAHEWRWALSSFGNRRKLANGGEGYVDLGACLYAAGLVLGVPEVREDPARFTPSAVVMRGDVGIAVGILRT